MRRFPRRGGDWCCWPGWLEARPGSRGVESAPCHACSVPSSRPAASAACRGFQAEQHSTGLCSTLREIFSNIYCIYPKQSWKRIEISVVGPVQKGTQQEMRRGRAGTRLLASARPWLGGQPCSRGISPWRRYTHISREANADVQCRHAGSRKAALGADQVIQMKLPVSAGCLALFFLFPQLCHS